MCAGAAVEASEELEPHYFAEVPPRGSPIVEASGRAVAAARITEELAHADSEMLQKSLARINAEMQTIEAGRTLLFATEKAEFDAEARAAREHKKAGTFGYQVLNDAGTEAVKIVDDTGNDLVVDALIAHEVVDDDPPLPAWARKGKVGH
jgi:hypothetical protein